MREKKEENNKKDKMKEELKIEKEKLEKEREEKEKYARRNDSSSVEAARARYLARKKKRVVAVEVDSD